MITLRLASLSLIGALVVFASATPGRAFTDAQLIDGFNRTVFGSEYQRFGWQSRLVKKFTKPVRLFVDDRSAAGRRGEVEKFVRRLPKLIAGLAVETVGSADEANFRVFVIDREAYRQVVSREVYGQSSSSSKPGKCLVRVVSTRSGITRSDAVIVADESDFLFRRCTVEEILQGLGPVNDDATLEHSVFNDSSRHSRFTSFDRHILNMLYHPLIQPGMTRRQAARVLPEVVADVQARLR